jgi:hypothetical protein
MVEGAFSRREALCKYKVLSLRMFCYTANSPTGGGFHGYTMSRFTGDLEL